MNNEAQFGVRFAVKGAKEIQKTMDAVNAQLKKLQKTTEGVDKKIDELGEKVNKSSKKGKNAFKESENNANSLSKSLDKVMKKWLSIGGAVTLVSVLMRRTFSKIDEYIGINRMANSAGIAAERIGSLGKKLKELYGGDASSAAAAYTSLSDILGAARHGRGISEDVVMAASRYGIALNGGMLSEDQLMTNIAKAMQAQRNRGNMFGVREIASAFGIDEALMLHLATRGANWDRNLPKYHMEEAKSAAEQARRIQTRLDQFLEWMIANGLNVIEKLGMWLDGVLKDQEPTNYSMTVNGKTTTAEKVSPGVYMVNGEKIEAKTPGEAISKALQSKPSIDPSVSDSIIRANLIAAKTRQFEELVNYYGSNVASSSGTLNALYGLNRALSKDGGSATFLPTAQPTILLTVKDESGVLKGHTIKVDTTGNFNVATPFE